MTKFIVKKLILPFPFPKITPTQSGITSTVFVMIKRQKKVFPFGIPL